MRQKDFARRKEGSLRLAGYDLIEALRAVYPDVPWDSKRFDDNKIEIPPDGFYDDVKLHHHFINNMATALGIKEVHTLAQAHTHILTSLFLFRWRIGMGLQHINFKRMKEGRSC